MKSINKVDNQQRLKNLILNGNYRNKFAVVDMECGTGKTYISNKAISELHNSGYKVLYVKKEIGDCKSSADNINSYFDTPIAYIYHSKLSKEEKENLKNKIQADEVPVLIICHEMYKKLCLSHDNIFIKNRTHLIIDEFISMIEELNITNSKLNALKELSRLYHTKNSTSTVSEMFMNVIAPLQEVIDRSTNTPVVTTIPNKTTNINNLNKLISYINDKRNIDIFKKEINHLKIDFGNTETGKWLSSLLKNNLSNLSNFFQNKVVIKNKTISTYNNNLSYLFANKNNIILDASGSLQWEYRYNSKLDLIHYPNAIDYNNINITNVIFDSTKTNKNKLKKQDDDFSSKVIDDIFGKYDIEETETLIIGSKDDRNNLKKYSNVAHFGNIVGKNNWKDLRNCIIFNTFNKRDTSYIVDFLYYNRTDDELSSLELDNSCYFKDYRLNAIKNKFIAESVYQAIMRVNRNFDKESKLLLLIKENEVIKLLETKLNKKITQDICRVKIENKTTSKNMIVPATTEGRFLKLIDEISNGKHSDIVIDNKVSKKDITDKLNILKYHLSRILHSNDVQVYLQSKNISIHTRYFQLNNTNN